MSQYVDGPTKTFTAGAAIGANLRVKLSAGVLAVAGASDIAIGTILAASLASGDIRAVRLRTASGTTKMVASVAITAGNPVYAAASGKVAATGTVYEGIAMETVTANGDVIEVMPAPNTDLSTAVAGTTNATFTADSDATTAKVAIGTGVGTGNFTATIVAPTLGADRTITLPAVTATLASLAGTETFTNKTLTSPVITTPTLTLGVQVLAAAGNAQGNAGAVTVASGGFVHATGADATKGIVLPAAAAGAFIIVKNADAANNVLKVYPASGDAINALSADAAISMAAKTSALFVAIDATTWYTVPLLPS